MAVHGAAAPAHQYASRFLRAARPIARPGAGEHARAARGPVAPRAQRLCDGLKAHWTMNNLTMASRALREH